MRIGFIGSTQGLFSAQSESIGKILQRYSRDVLWTDAFIFNHGGNRGGDKSFHEMLFYTEFRECRINVRLHEGGSYNSNDIRSYNEKLFKYKYSSREERDLAIITESVVIIVCPATASENKEHRTWKAVKIAKKVGRRVYLILPTGTCRES